MIPKIRDHCIRCGTCCKKGGPTLHTEDQAIFLRQHPSPFEVLVTYRQGELAYHPVRNTLIVLPCDMIKIKGKPNNPSCLFFHEASKACTIYDSRPLECRLLKCWDPGPVQAIFLKDLMRREMLLKDKDLIKIVHIYDKKLPPDLVARLVKEKNKMALEALEVMDQRIRKAVLKGFGISAKALDAILGRPVQKLREAFQSIM